MHGRTTWIISAAALSAMLVGCSSSGSSPGSAAVAPSGTTSASATASRQGYLDAVNALCDALLPKVISATHGGSINVPVHEWLATWPAHKRLLDGFDTDVAAISIPPAARTQAAALTAYIRFASRLDSARLTAAHKGQSAWAKEVQSESSVDYDPAIAALTAAGFNQSCTAR